MFGTAARHFRLRNAHRREVQKSRHCNLCGRTFREHYAFERFCPHCKKEEWELLEFSDWLGP